MISVDTYVHWQKDEDRACRVFSALAPDHPAYGAPCIACGRQLGDGTPVQILALGPGADDEDRAKHRDGRWYSAAAWIVHALCLGTERAPDV